MYCPQYRGDAIYMTYGKPPDHMRELDLKCPAIQCQKHHHQYHFQNQPSPQIIICPIEAPNFLKRIFTVLKGNISQAPYLNRYH